MSWRRIIGLSSILLVLLLATWIAALPQVNAITKPMLQSASFILSAAGDWSFTGKLSVPNSTTPPTADCDEAGEQGRLYLDSDAASGQRLYWCQGTGGWKTTSGLTTTDSTPTTLTLTDNGTNQTLTGNLGNLALSAIGSITTARPTSFTGTSNAFTQATSACSTSGDFTVGRAAGGRLLFQTDNVSDIGDCIAQNNRPKNACVAGTVVTGGDVQVGANLSVGQILYTGSGGLVNAGESAPCGGVTIGDELCPYGDVFFSWVHTTDISALEVFVTADVVPVYSGTFPSIGSTNRGFDSIWLRDQSAIDEVKFVAESSVTPTAERTLKFDWRDSNGTYRFWRFGSATIDFGSLTAPNCADSTGITVTGAADAQPCEIGVGNAAMNAAGSQFTCWVSAANTVKVRHCCIVGTCDPGSATFRVDVMND